MGIVDEVRARTAQGTRALRRAALRGDAARTAYLAAGAVSVAAAATGADRVTRVVKPMLMPLLAAGAVQRSSRPRTDLAIVLAGLAGGLVGDVVLMGRDSRSGDVSVRARNLNLGAAAFTVNQVAHQAALLRRGARVSPAAAAVRLPVWLGGVGLSARLLPAALPAAAGYGAALGLTSALADDPRFRAGSVAEGGLGHGGNLFMLSDGLILARLTLLRRLPVLDRLADGAVMATYVLAQLLLVDGLTE